jgi:hypothetical protein
MMSAFLDQWFELQPGTDQFARVGAAGAPPQGITPRCAGRAAIHLCLTTPVVISMTATQRSVFLRLCILQQEEAGPHGLLPGVVDALLALARQPWWDEGLAGIQFEPQ